MTKDEFITALDHLVANPDNLIESANKLRQAVSEDYDTMLQNRNLVDSLTQERDTLTKDLQDMKDLNLKLFLSQPNVTVADPNPKEPNINPPLEPKVDAYESIDALVSDIQTQLCK